MKASRKSVLALIGAMAMGVAAAAPSVEITSVQQQYPWTNTVDIVYNVAGVIGDEGYFVKFTPTTSDNQQILDVNNQPSIEVALTNSGTYTAQWYPQTNQQYTACKMTPSVFRGAAKDYLIIDLEDWTVAYEPMATQEASNQRYNTAEYKTKKMVFRKIPAGRYTIGHDNFAAYRATYGTGNAAHEVYFPEDYYIAIFRLTRAQYARIANNNTSENSMYCQSGVSWNSMRGSALAAAKPSSGPLAKMQQNTGLCVDLPTHAMDETARRAGSTAEFASGDSATGNWLYGWTTYDNGSSSAHNVGEKLPNAWGIYDVIGLYYSLYRDVTPSTSYTAVEPTFDNNFMPVSTGNNSYRGASDYWYSLPYSDRRAGLSSTWIATPANADTTYYGHRLAVYPEAYYPNGGK